jgi:hypothetical protein
MGGIFACSQPHFELTNGLRVSEFCRGNSDSRYLASTEERLQPKAMSLLSFCLTD